MEEAAKEFVILFARLHTFWVACLEEDLLHVHCLDVVGFILIEYCLISNSIDELVTPE